MKHSGWRRWVWVLDAAAAVLGVAIGVATNQILNNGKWGWWWLAGDLFLAGAAAAATHKTAAIRAADGEEAVHPVPWPTLIGSDGQPKIFNEVTPRDLGVQPNRFGSEGEAFYIPRDVDDALDIALTESARRVVIAAGPRLAGTTSTLAQAAQCQLPEHRVVAFVDDPRVRLIDMIDQARPWAEQDPGAVLWLDGLAPYRFTELATMPLNHLPKGLWVLATLDTRQLEGLRLPAHVAKALEEHAVRAELGLLSAAERAELHAQDIYAELRPTLDEGTGLLMGRLMVTWEQIREALTEPHEDSTHRLALVHAVTDWYRISVPRLLNRHVLDYLYQVYHAELTGRPTGTSVVIDDRNSALTWTTTKTEKRPRLISWQEMTDGARYAPHPLLTVLAQDPHEETAWPVADALWRYTDLIFKGDQRRDIGYTALRLDAYPAARRLLNHTDTTIDSGALFQIARWLHKSGDHQGARHWYRRTVAAGDPDYAPRAILNLGALEDEQGDAEQARHWYRNAIATDHPDYTPLAMLRLGLLESEHGRRRVARSWLRQAIDSGHADAAPQAMVLLGALEDEQGHAEQARRWYRNAIATDHPDYTPLAMFRLGLLESEHGRRRVARSWLRQAIDSGHADYTPLAMFRLGLLESEHGRRRVARSWLRQAIDSGHADAAPQAMVSLGRMEHLLDNFDGAHSWYEQAVASKHQREAPMAAYYLGMLESKHGDIDAGRIWYRRSIDNGHPDSAPPAMTNLAVMEDLQGNIGSARILYMKAINTAHPEAASKAIASLGAMELQLGNTSSARSLFLRAISAGHPEAAQMAMVSLAGLEAMEAKFDIARDWCRRAITGEDSDISSIAKQQLFYLNRTEEHLSAAEHFTRFGWQAYADPELMRRRGARASETADPPDNEDGNDSLRPR
jgi:tetratricopeptide (TPR) repeat protein